MAPLMIILILLTISQQVKMIQFVQILWLWIFLMMKKKLPPLLLLASLLRTIYGTVPSFLLLLRNSLALITKQQNLVWSKISGMLFKEKILKLWSWLKVIPNILTSSSIEPLLPKMKKEVITFEDSRRVFFKLCLYWMMVYGTIKCLFQKIHVSYFSSSHN